MTIEEVHNYNRRNAISDISYNAVGKSEAISEMRSWLSKWLALAYEAGYKAAKEGEV